MKLKRITIANYRQFSNAVINFDDELTILAGANNSGKTSIIELFKRLHQFTTFINSSPFVGQGISGLS